MRLPLAILSALCLAFGVFSPWILYRLGPVISVATGFDYETVREPLAASGEILVYVSAVSVLVLVLSAGFFLLGRTLLARRTVGRAVTWDCGYAAPSPRMQYTASSFIQPLTALFYPFVMVRKHYEAPKQIFPRSQKLITHSPELFREYFYDPLFRAIAWAASQFRRLQHGNIHLYVLYIAVTLLVLLIWKLGAGL